MTRRHHHHHSRRATTGTTTIPTRQNAFTEATGLGDERGLEMQLRLEPQVCSFFFFFLFNFTYDYLQVHMNYGHVTHDYDDGNNENRPKRHVRRVIWAIRKFFFSFMFITY